MEKECVIVFSSRLIHDDTAVLRGDFAHVNSDTGIPVEHKIGNIGFCTFALLSDDRRKAYCKSINAQALGFLEEPKHLTNAAIELADYQSLSCFGHDFFADDLLEICDNRGIIRIFFNGKEYAASEFCSKLQVWEQNLRYEKYPIDAFTFK